MLAKGNVVRVSCEISEGTFPDEKMVTVESANGPISGFVRRNSIHSDGARSFLEGVVEDITDKKIAVKLMGSFFTTTGLAHFSQNSLICD